MLLCTPFVIQNLVLDDWNFARASYMFFFNLFTIKLFKSVMFCVDMYTTCMPFKVKLTAYFNGHMKTSYVFHHSIVLCDESNKTWVKAGVSELKIRISLYFFRWTVTCPFQMKDHSVKKSCGGILNDWCYKSKICNIHHLIYGCLC